MNENSLLTIPTPPAEHPRLFVRAQDLPALQAKLNHPDLQPVWKQIIAASQSNPDGTLPTPEPGRTNYDKTVREAIEAAALRYLLTGDQALGQLVITSASNFLASVVFVPNGVGYHDVYRDVGRSMIMGAMTYDWVYNLLTPEQKGSFIKNLKRIAADLETGYPPVIGTYQGAVVGHGSEEQVMQVLIGTGLAIYDEEPDMYNDSVSIFFKEFVPVRNFFYPSGTHWQGSDYGPYRYRHELMASMLFSRMGYGNPFDAAQGQLPYRWIYERRPDGQYMREGDSYNSHTFNPQHGLLWRNPMQAMLAANLFSDPYFEDEFVRQFSYENPSSDYEPVYQILVRNLEQPSSSLINLPLTRYFGYPQGSMIARTGWDTAINNNSSTVVAQMNIGGYQTNNHQRLDKGDFQIYYKGALAMNSGIYQGVDGEYASSHFQNYYQRTISHNSLLVFDPGEVTRFHGNTVVSNDGGQRWPNDGIEPKRFQDLLTKNYYTSTVLGHAFGPDQDAPDYSYLKGDLTKAYTDKVQQVYRSFVFLNLKNSGVPAVMVVHDNVSASNPSFKKTWLLHSIEQPQINGNVTTVQRTQNGYNGKLVNTTLLPAQAVLSVVGGSGNEFLVNGANYPNSPFPRALGCEEPGTWRLEVSPPTAQTADEFLNVLQVMDTTGTELPVNQIDAGVMTGVNIADRVVLFSKSGQRLNDSLSLNIASAEPTLKYVITDLAPGYWTITAPDATSTTGKVTQEGGVLYFEGTPGQYSLTLKSNQNTTPPTAPANLRATTGATTGTPGGSSVFLSWSASSDDIGIAAYDIYNGSTLVGSTISGETTSFNVTGLNLHTTYNFSVKARNAAGRVSDASNLLTLATIDTESPSQPGALNIENLADTQLTLKWSASTDNIGLSGYDIYQSNPLFGATLIGSTTEATSFDVTGLSANTTYSFYVRARDAKGNVSVPSIAAAVTTLASA